MAKTKNNYTYKTGRSRIESSNLHTAYELYRNGKINMTVAGAMCSMSRQTFARRIKQLSLEDRNVDIIN